MVSTVGYKALPNALQQIAQGESNALFLVFCYTRGDIFEEVYKRTSYIGKSRFDKEGKNLLDTIALTQDDSDVFESLLYNACAVAFSYFSGFTKKHIGAYNVLSKSGIEQWHSSTAYVRDDIVLDLNGNVRICTVDTASPNAMINTEWKQLPDYFYTDDKILFLLEKLNWFNENLTQPAGNYIFEIIINHIIYKWFEMVWTTDALIYYEAWQGYANNLGSLLNSANANESNNIRRYRPLG